MLSATILNDAPIKSRAKLSKEIGRSTVALWRWEKLGWIDPAINIAGRPFYTQAAIEKFIRRASAGEFARAPHAPRKEKASAA